MQRRLPTLRLPAALAVAALALAAVQSASAADTGRPAQVDLANRQIASQFNTDNGFKPADQHIGQELADKLMNALLDGRKAPKEKSTLLTFSAKHPTRPETYAAALVVPGHALPPATPVPVCFSTNGKPTSAWYLMPDGRMEAGLIVPNLPEQVKRKRPACFATLMAAREAMESHAAADASAS